MAPQEILDKLGTVLLTDYIPTGTVYLHPKTLQKLTGISDEKLEELMQDLANLRRK